MLRKSSLEVLFTSLEGQVPTSEDFLLSQYHSTGTYYMLSKRCLMGQSHHLLNPYIGRRGKQGSSEYLCGLLGKPGIGLVLAQLLFSKEAGILEHHGMGCVDKTETLIWEKTLIYQSWHLVLPLSQPDSMGNYLFFHLEVEFQTWLAIMIPISIRYSLSF